MCSWIIFSQIPSPYFDTASVTANRAASAKNVKVPAAGSRRVTDLSAIPSVLLKWSFNISFIELLIKETIGTGV